MSDSRREKLQCNECHGTRWHVLCADHRIEGREEVDGEVEPWTDYFEIFQCQGCDSVHVRRSFCFALLGEEPALSYFPARISRHKPQWSQDLPDELQDLLWEVYGALHADSPRLALMGIRAVIDVAIHEKVGDVGTFREKLAALENKGFVGKQQREFLEAVLDAGNAAAHRGHAASAQELEFAMDIVENLLQAVYALGRAAKHIRGKTPPRQMSAKGATLSKP
jgi:hypothetical protein